jgi:hypothetical protein
MVQEYPPVLPPFIAIVFTVLGFTLFLFTGRAMKHYNTMNALLDTNPSFDRNLTSRKKSRKHKNQEEKIGAWEEMIGTITYYTYAVLLIFSICITTCGGSSVTTHLMRLLSD